MTFGQGSANFLINSPACVEQLIVTGLQLFQGSWFLNTAAGTPWLQSVIGFGTQAEYDQVIQNQIKSTQGVTGINAYSSSLNAATRLLTFTVSGTSIFGPFTLTSTFSMTSGFGVIPEAEGAGGFGQ
jgi:hypothetical protein